MQSLDARVRCGMCYTVFNARDELEKEVQPNTVAQAKAEPIETAPPPPVHVPPHAAANSEPVFREDDPLFQFDADDIEEIDISSDETVQFSAEELPEAESPAGLDIDVDYSKARDDEFFGTEEEVETSFEEDTPSEEEIEDTFEMLGSSSAEMPKQGRKSRWWLIGSVVLLLAVATQWVYANRSEIMASPQLQPLMNHLCKHMGCTLDPLRDLDKIELLRRSVYSHPNIDKALIISLAVINNADFSQPFPVLRIRMADVRGQIVAQRDFEPENYLDGTSAGQQMAPGSPVTVTLEIHDPGNDALTFELEFL